MARSEERAIVNDFGERYLKRDLAAALEVERIALGTACGANGYTTLDQADRLADLLSLESSHTVLDLGCGCGWPGLHLARRAGCAVVGTDLPLEGLVRAGRNASKQGTGAAGYWIRSSARAIPFRAGAFDAIVHADVLC